MPAERDQDIDLDVETTLREARRLGYGEVMTRRLAEAFVRVVRRREHVTEDGTLSFEEPKPQG